MTAKLWHEDEDKRTVLKLGQAHDILGTFHIIQQRMKHKKSAFKNTLLSVPKLDATCKLVLAKPKGDVIVLDIDISMQSIIYDK